MKWNGSNKNKYVKLGYSFTKLGDYFDVKLKDVTHGSDIVVNVNCDDCGKVIKMKYNYYNKRINNNKGVYCESCIQNHCDRTHKTKEELYSKFLEFCDRNMYTPISSIDECVNTLSYVVYKCPKHGIQKICIASIFKDTIGCDQCITEKVRLSNNYTPDEVKQLVESKNNNILLNKDDYINVNTKNLQVICGNCGNIFTTSLSSINSSDGKCQKCGYRIGGSSLKIKKEELISKIPGIINPDDYVDCETSNLKIICPECGEIFITSYKNYVHFNKNRCDICSKAKSIGEIIIENILNCYSINFISQYKFDECKDKKPLPFDFYLQDYNTCIEFNGQFHYLPIYTQERLEYVQKHDKIKSDFCANNGINLIVIPYWNGHDMEEIITGALNIKNNNYNKIKFHK